MLTKDDLIAVARRLAASTGATTVPRREFFRESGVSERTIRRFFGSYNALVEAAGLQPQSFPTSDAPKYSSADMVAELVRVFRLPGAKLTTIYFEQNSRMSLSAVQRRFGGWGSALRAALPSLDPQQDAETVSKIGAYLGPEANAHPPPSAVGPQPSLSVAPQASHDLLPDVSANVYGDFINFRGLQHAPVNEQGVVFLFGMICRELGYVVELVRSGFPDCEAKRRIAGRSGKWQRVRIEFEYQSRSFLAHGHDPDQCDVIVCWEDTWRDCPLEVLELRSALTELPIAMQP